MTTKVAAKWAMREIRRWRDSWKHIIKKLADGDPYYHQRYPVDVRLEILWASARASSTPTTRGLSIATLSQQM